MPPGEHNSKSQSSAKIASGPQSFAGNKPTSGSQSLLGHELELHEDSSANRRGSQLEGCFRTWTCISRIIGNTGDTIRDEKTMESILLLCEQVLVESSKEKNLDTKY